MKVLFVISNSGDSILVVGSHSSLLAPDRAWRRSRLRQPQGRQGRYDSTATRISSIRLRLKTSSARAFCRTRALVAKFETTLKLADVNLTSTMPFTWPADAVRPSISSRTPMRQGAGAFWAKDKVVGAIRRSAIALGNIPARIRGKRTTGYTLEADLALQKMFGPGFVIPHYPQTVLEETGSVYSRLGNDDPYIIRDGKLVTGQNQQSASEYSIVLLGDNRQQPGIRRLI